MDKEGRKSEEGVIILEATFCLLVSLLVVFLLMSAAFWLYQQVMVGVVCNEVASEVAQNYKLLELDDNNSVSLEDVTGVGKYRYSIFKKSFEQKNEKKAADYTRGRLAKTSLAQSAQAPEVKITTSIDDIGRRHYEVTVTQRYTFLLGRLLEFIGQKETQTISRTAYVQSTDMLSYVNTVKTQKYLADKLTGNTKTGKAVNSIISAVNSVVKLVRSWTK